MNTDGHLIGGNPEGSDFPASVKISEDQWFKMVWSSGFGVRSWGTDFEPLMDTDGVEWGGIRRFGFPGFNEHQ